MTTSLQQEMKGMSSRKLAMRFLTMGTEERRKKTAEFFSGPGARSTTQDGVDWQTQGTYEGGVLQVSYTATPSDRTTWVTGSWVLLNNGTGEDAPSLGCSATVADGLQTTGTSSTTGAMYYVPQGPLQPVVVATLIAQLNTGGQSQVNIQIPISSTAA